MLTRLTLECLVHVCAQYVFATCTNFPQFMRSTLWSSPCHSQRAEAQEVNQKSNRVTCLISRHLNPGPFGSGPMSIATILLHHHDESVVNIQQMISQSCLQGHVSADRVVSQKTQRPSEASLNSTYPCLCICGSLCLECPMPYSSLSLNPFFKVEFRCYPQASAAHCRYCHD